MMSKRKALPSEVVADVLATSRRRCCICFALANDATEKRGQIAHLDRDASNDAPENLVYMCLDHHDQYDSRTSQSKGFTVAELKRYQAQLTRYIAQSLPKSDLHVARALLASLDRPAFRTPFQQESSLPRFREAIAETIASINTGKTPAGEQLPSKHDLHDDAIRGKLDSIVGALVALRATFDGLLRTKDIQPCGCNDPNCPVFMLSLEAIQEMDRKRRELLLMARSLDSRLPIDFYGEMG